MDDRCTCGQGAAHLPADDVLTFEQAAAEQGCTVDELFGWLIECGAVEECEEGWEVTAFGVAAGLCVPLT